MRRGLSALLSKIRQATKKAKSPVVAEQLRWFVKVTRSYWAGRFHCYASAGVPRTNNDLEQYFGSARYHQRRASGRRHATAATVVRGPVRVLAATASRLTLVRE